MKVLYIVLIIVFYDCFLTKVYCKIRKNRSLKKKILNENDTVVLNASTTRKIESSIISYIEGYILYKCSIMQYIPSHHIRKFILKYQFEMEIHSTAMVYHGSEFRHPWNIKIGAGSSIGDHSKLDGRNGIDIGNNVNVGSGCWIWTEQHDYNDVDFQCNDKGGKVVVGDYAWLSSRTSIMPGCIIGKGSVVGAGAVVTKNCEDYALYVGCPAHKISERNREIAYDLAGQYLHFY